MTVNVVKDVSTLSTISEKDIAKLLKKFIYSICCGIEESIIAGENITEADLGIGTLYIKHEPDSDLQYKFVPCRYFEKNIKSTINDKRNPLEEELNSSLAKKFLNVYKDLC